MDESGIGGPSAEDKGITPVMSEAPTENVPVESLQNTPTTDKSTQDVDIAQVTNKTPNDAIHDTTEPLPTTNSVEKKSDTWNSLSSEEKTARSIGLAKKKIQARLEAGTLTNKEKTQAELAIAYVGSGTPEDARAFNAMLGIVKSSGDSNLLDNLQKNLLVVDSGDNYYTHAEWDQKLASLSATERATLEQQVRYGYQFDEQENSTLESSEDQEIAKQLAIVRIKIEEALVSGDEEQLSKLTEAQTKLEIATLAKGEVSILIKYPVLGALSTEGFQIDATPDSVKYSEAKQKFEEFLVKKGMSHERLSQMTSLIATADIEGFIQASRGENLNGLDELIFGRKLDENDLQKVMDSDLVTPDLKKKLVGGARMSGIILLYVLLASTATALSATQKIAG